MQITAYTDDSFNTLYKTMELPVSPDKVKLNKGIRYAEDKQLGSLNGSNVYVRYQPETLYFECLLDVTNALEEDKGKILYMTRWMDSKDCSTTTTPRDTVRRLSRWSTATSLSSDN